MTEETFVNPAVHHFYPDKDDLPNLASELKKHITCPIERVMRATHHDPKDPPFEVVATSWYWLDEWGALHKNKFFEQLEGALSDLGGLLSESHRHYAYPITYNPKVVVGVAYHTWSGVALDVRLIIKYGQVDDANSANGVTFMITTLREKKKQ